MRALVMDAHGTTDVLRLQELPDPTAGPGEVLVRVRASSLNPLDAKLRQAPRPWAPFSLPAVLGCDAAGTIVAVGPGVEDLVVGDDVLYFQPPVDGRGAHADLQAAKAPLVVRAPSALTFVEAGALPLAGVAAWQACERAQVSEGDVVLVHGAAGGVGSMLLQLLAARGAQVIATVYSAGAERAAELGAQLVMRGAEDDWATAVLDATEGAGADVCIDLVGGDTTAESIQAMRPRGRLVAMVDVNGDVSSASLKNLTLEFVLVEPRRSSLEGVVAAVEQGTLRPVIDEVVTLDDVPRAQKRLERGGVVGKVAVRISADADAHPAGARPG